MARKLPLYRKEAEEEPASAEVSRLLVLGFVIAALLGLAMGTVWIIWSLLRIHVFG
jgi:hypothetical protein